MISDIKTALTEFWNNTIDIFSSFASYSNTLISELKNSITLLKDVVQEVPPIFSSFLLMSIILSVGFLVLNRGRVN